MLLVFYRTIIGVLLLALAIFVSSACDIENTAAECPVAQEEPTEVFIFDCRDHSDYPKPRVKTYQ